MNSKMEAEGLCQICGGPLLRDELTGLQFCAECDTIISRLPHGRTYMLVGESGSGKTVLFYKLNELYLRNGNPCIFVAYDEHPDQIRSSMRNFIKKLDVYEAQGLLSFVDCYSCIGGLKSQEKHYIASPGDINELNLKITGLVSDLNTREPIKVFLDSSTAMFIHCQTESVLKFLFAMSAKLKPRNGSLFFTLGQGAVSEEVQKKLEQIADGLMELKLLVTAARVKRYYRISKVRGTLYFDAWLPFFIGKESIHLGHPEEPEALERFQRIFQTILAQK